MLQRALVLEGVGERHQQLFRAAGVRHFRQLAQRSSWDVAHAVDLSVREVEELLAKVSVRLAPQSRSAFDMFLESVNHPVFLRTGLPTIDHALCGGIKHGGIVEFAGVAGIGKSQLAMTLSVLCALENPDASVLYIDTERNVSAKRLLQIAHARVRLRSADASADVETRANAVVQRVHIASVDSLAKFLATLKELEATLHALRVKLVVVDSVAGLFLKSSDQTHAQRQHQMLKLARDLKLLADTHQVFVVVTNRAVVAESDAGLYTRPELGETWSHCITSRLIMERYPQHRVVSIVKSPVAGYAVQPFVIDDAGVQAAEEPHGDDDFDSIGLDDALLSDAALAGLQTVEPSCTLQSTQKSTAHDDVADADPDSDLDTSSVCAIASTRRPRSQHELFDLVSDSNDEDDSAERDDASACGSYCYEHSIADLLEER